MSIELTALASALHSKVWPIVSRREIEACQNLDTTAEQIDAENAMMNREVPRLAPLLVKTPVEILANIWGVHPLEAEQWRREIETALAAA